jgi:hypothetical protein
MRSHQPILVWIIAASAVSLGAYGVWLKRTESTAPHLPQTHPFVSLHADSQQADQSEKLSVESDAVHRANVPRGTESSPATDETPPNGSVLVETHLAHESGASGPEPEAPILVLTREVGYRLSPHAYHDLLRFIMEQEIQETGLDLEAARLLEATILEFAVARGMPSDVHLGISDVQCTASLCTLLRDFDGTFFRFRMSPEWRAMEKQGAVPIVSWVGLGTGEREGHMRVYMFRPAIELHRDLLEAVVAGP